MVNKTTIYLFFIQFNMGINKTPDELGHQSSLNGYDGIYGAAHWRDNLVSKRPQKSKAVIFISIDIIALCILIGIVKRIDDIKELLVWIVSFLWMSGRVYLGYLRVMAFVGKNSEWIKKGKKDFKELIKKPD